MTYFLVFATSAILSLVAGAAVRRGAIRYGAVVPLRPDRWHTRPTPTFGGVAVVAAMIATLSAFGWIWLPDAALTGAVLGVGAGLFAIGSYDDVWPFFAVAKIVTTLAAAAFFIFTLVYLMPSLKPAEDSAVLSLIAILVFTGLDNAVNLLDNMDGLAAGVTAITAVFLALTFEPALGPGLFVVLIALAGALLGFLAWNRHPARLFMGNCGSLAVGGILAACATVAVARIGTIEAAIAAGLILLTPIFDTSFVILLRRLAGRSTTAGYIDHVSHRLVSAGSSEPRAVLILYLLTAAGGSAGYLLQVYGATTWPIPTLVVVATIMLGLYLARVPAYGGQDFVALQDSSFKPLSDLTMKWHLGEVILDLVLIATCYYTAYYLRFEGQALTVFLWSFRASLPLMLGCQIAALYGSGLYSRAWSTFGFHDLWPVVRGVGIGSALASLVITGLYKNTPEYVLFSIGVFIIDAILLVTAITATRLSFRILSGVAATTAGPSRQRVMIYGAGVRGQMLVREMLANPAWLRHPVGFFDDDVAKHGRRLMGVPVRGSVQDMQAILQKLSVTEVLLSSPSINGSVEARIREVCGAMHVPVRRLYMELR